MPNVHTVQFRDLGHVFTMNVPRQAAVLKYSTLQNQKQDHCLNVAGAGGLLRHPQCCITIASLLLAPLCTEQGGLFQHSPTWHIVSVVTDMALILTLHYNNVCIQTQTGMLGKQIALGHLSTSSSGCSGKQDVSPHPEHFRTQTEF